MSKNVRGWFYIDACHSVEEVQALEAGYFTDQKIYSIMGDTDDNIDMDV